MVACVIHSVSKKLNGAPMSCCALLITQSQPPSLCIHLIFSRRWALATIARLHQLPLLEPILQFHQTPASTRPPPPSYPFLRWPSWSFQGRSLTLNPQLLQDQEDLLPKLMKPKENWNETNEAINKVWPNLLIKGWIGHILKALCYCNVRQTKQLFSYDECDNIFLHQVETSVWAEIWNQD